MTNHTRPVLRAFACALALLTAAGCIDDPTALAEGELPLTAAEANILGLTVWRDVMIQQRDALGGDTFEQPFLSIVDRSEDGRLDLDLVLIEDCDFGGEREVDGFLNGESDAEGNGVLEFRIVQDWRSCALVEDGERFVLTGDPNVDATLRIEFTAEGSIDISGRMVGTVRTALPGGRSGRCDYSVTFSSAGTEDGGTVFRTKGTMCNQAVNLREVL